MRVQQKQSVPILVIAGIGRIWLCHDNEIKDAWITSQLCLRKTDGPVPSSDFISSWCLRLSLLTNSTRTNVIEKELRCRGFEMTLADIWRWYGSRLWSTRLAIIPTEFTSRLLKTCELPTSITTSFPRHAQPFPATCIQSRHFSSPSLTFVCDRAPSIWTSQSDPPIMLQSLLTFQR